MPSLIVQGDGREEVYGLTSGATSLGRGLDADIRLKDIRSSRKHCQIVRTPAGWKIVDLSSGNGTLVNGKPVQKEQPIQFGDRIRIGTTDVLFSSDAGPAKASAGGQLSPEERARAFQQTSRMQPVKEEPPTRRITTRAGGPDPAAAPGMSTTRRLAAGAAAGGGTTRLGKTTGRLGVGTQRVGTATTGRLKVATQRLGTGTGRMKGTGRLTARHVSQSRRAVNPVIAAAVGGAVILLVAIVAIYINSGTKGPDAIVKEGKEIYDKGTLFHRNHQWSEAIGKYNEAENHVKGVQAEIPWLRDLKQNRKEAEEMKKLEDAAPADLDILRGKVENARKKPDEAIQLLPEAQNLYATYQKTKCAHEIKKLVDEIEEIRKEAVKKLNPDEYFAKASVDRGNNRFGDAIRWLEDFKQANPGHARTGDADKVIEDLKRAAEKFWKGVQARVQKTEDRDEKIKMLDGALRKLKGTPLEGEVEAALEKAKA